MKKMMLPAALLLVCVGLHGQESRPSDFQRQTLEELLQPFALTNNAAGMGLSQPSAGSRTELGVFREAGDFHLAQQGKADLGFDFSTLRYDTFSDKLFMKGTFHYGLDREKERAWSDVMDPWFSIPYIYGSSVAKDYLRHNAGLGFDLYTAPLWDRVSFGVRTVYDVADISGLRDPRPRTGYLEWQVVPSVLVTFGPHHVGLDAGYGHAKEKLTNLTTIQSYPNLYYYKMSGLDHVDGAIAAYSGFKRQFAGGRVLGDLSYGYSGEAVNLVVSVGAEYRKLDAYGDKKQSPGSYNSFTYKGLADMTLRRSNLFHHFRLEGKYRDGGADEYLQELWSWAITCTAAIPAMTMSGAPACAAVTPVSASIATCPNRPSKRPDGPDPSKGRSGFSTDAATRLNWRLRPAVTCTVTWSCNCRKTISTPGKCWSRTARITRATISMRRGP